MKKVQKRMASKSPEKKLESVKSAEVSSPLAEKYRK